LLRRKERALDQPPTIGADAAIESQLKKLSARSRHVAFLLGSGASKACGLPTLSELLGLVKADLGDADKASLDYAFDGDPNLEEGLSRLRRLHSVLSDGAKVEGVDITAIDSLDKSICTSIRRHLTAEGNIEPYRRLAAWLNSQQYLRPVELFTLNYDLLIETAFEEEKVHFFDGFVGALAAAFRSDLVEIMNDATRSLPPSCTRLWKLHGSLNWKLVGKDESRHVVRTGAPVSDALAIFPSEDKYTDSRRVPFVVLMDRFRRALQEPESITIVCGYSFGDQHLNELLFDAARLYPRSELWVTCHSNLPETLRAQALLYPNIVAHSSEEAVVGGRTYKWVGDASAYFDGASCKFGDFDTLTSILLPDAKARDEQPTGN